MIDLRLPINMSRFCANEKTACFGETESFYLARIQKSPWMQNKAYGQEEPPSENVYVCLYACIGRLGERGCIFGREERTHPLGEGETHLEVGNYAHGLAKDRGGLEHMLGGHTSISIGRGVILNISASGGRC